MGKDSATKSFFKPHKRNTVEMNLTKNTNYNLSKAWSSAYFIENQDKVKYMKNENEN